MPTISERKESGAAVLDVSETLVRSLIIAFYEKLKSDPSLGPVFRDIIGPDWDLHIEKICSFWLYVTRLKVGYETRNFISAHIKHPSIDPQQLPHWLRLFRETTEELCSPQASTYLVNIAERMAVSIQISLARRDGDAVI